MSFKRLWFAFAAVVGLSFAVSGWTGLRICQQARPVPRFRVADPLPAQRS